MGLNVVFFYGVCCEAILCAIDPGAFTCTGEDSIPPSWCPLGFILVLH